MRAILTYHSIDSSGSVISVSRETFRRHVEWLASSSVRVVSLADLLAQPEDRDAVALTFDDGFENFASVAAPILEDHGVTATVFVVSRRVGSVNSWEPPNEAIPRFELMDWSRIGRVVDAGFEIGAHSRTHPYLTDLTPSELETEIAGCVEDIEEEVGVRPVSFAYPYGAVNDGVEEVVSDWFDHACTADLAPLGEEPVPTRLPRLDMYYFRKASRLESWGSTAFRWRLSARRAGRRLRARVTPGRSS